MKKITFLIFCFFIISLLISINNVSSESEKFYVWVVSDTHVGDTASNFVGTPLAKVIWQDVLHNISVDNWDFDWDIALLLGDTVHNANEAQFQDFRDSLEDITGHNKEDIYILSGNHDSRFYNSNAHTYWANYIDPSGNNPVTSYVNNSLRPYPVENASTYDNCFTLQVGNTLFVMWGEDIYDNVDSRAYNLTWFEGVVDNASEDVNIIVATHHPVHTSPTELEGNNITETDSPHTWLSENEGRVDAWFNAHIHYTESHARTYNGTKWGTFFLNPSSVQDSTEKPTGSMSMILEFTEDSKTVNVYDYYHGYSSNDFSLTGEPAQFYEETTYRGNQSFLLGEPFNLLEDEPDSEQTTNTRNLPTGIIQGFSFVIVLMVGIGLVVNFIVANTRF